MTKRVERLTLAHVKYMPQSLESGVLYVSEEFAIAGHLCACGCGQKVMTPLGPAEWKFADRGGVPSLWPSIGNWQLPCRSHYVIREGSIVWAGDWTENQVLAGRAAEERRREAYYAGRQMQRVWWRRLWRWIRGLLN